MSGGSGAPPGWQVVAALSAFPASGLHDVVVDRTLVLLIRDRGAVRAVQGKCPHDFARLADGRIEPDGRLRCPRHMALFDPGDGRCGPGWALPPLRRYAVRLDGDAVLLQDPLTPLA